MVSVFGIRLGSKSSKKSSRIPRNMDPIIGRQENLISTIPTNIEVKGERLYYSMEGFQPLSVHFYNDLHMKYDVSDIQFLEAAYVMVKFEVIDRIEKGDLATHIAAAVKSREEEELPRVGPNAKAVLVMDGGKFYRGKLLPIPGRQGRLQVSDAPHETLHDVEEKEWHQVFLVDEGRIVNARATRIWDITNHEAARVPIQMFPLCLPSYGLRAPRNLTTRIKSYKGASVTIYREQNLENPDNLVLHPKLMLQGDGTKQTDLLDLYEQE
ncbi:hypothetical protein L596_005663 [Steinernema carpocapsae]|uniref:Tudor domain-containing protein n=1 Tax=Steinernema carpocapsae TaxID=34508 RepID=A0A4U8V0Z9_STECR|nr:hypothetical protein L596_005663 [Steinernema carpocapsae]